MTTAYAINWDNGNNACGTFPDRFATEEQAQQFAEDWMNERNYECGGEDCYTAEVIEIEEYDDEEQEEPFDPFEFGWVGRDGRP